jgi:hypothetical protein
VEVKEKRMKRGRKGYTDLFTREVGKKNGVADVKGGEHEM